MQVKNLKKIPMESFKEKYIFGKQSAVGQPSSCRARLMFVWYLVSIVVLLRIAMETYIRQRQLIMSPLITSHVIGENEPLTSVFNKVIAAKEVNHKGQGTAVE